ncbi:hypothetical protein APUTEX25_003203 [Auxenochlorella protothecoides]|uniref:Peptidase M3A/M3B catalytic domain-containing protein n=1 Tax=Auxenochlorella protothecoides TaxID=3075 RepID=A0A3M7KUZ5_AUXPR|nr:hypothetical protein APUTEX25_003203 [Auxenochlorella protothecoides]|eukprot:RMZ53669.1 hypothetical protein APUTEX25_003203 [Auxenochlorella protothecoides]
MAATALPGNPDVSAFIQGINDKYLEVHRAYEDNFWATKMALSGASTSALSSTKNALDEFLSSQDRLRAVCDAEARPDLSPEQLRVLAVLRRTFATYVSEEESVATLRARLNDLEAELAGVRNRMRLGTTDPATGEFRPASSVQLRNAMRMSGEESARRAAYDALRSIGPAIAGPFAAIVRLRNELARRAGFPNYYEMKVQAAEGFTQARLFQMLDGLESATRQLATDARARLAAAKGEDSLKSRAPDPVQPWNISNALAGDIETRMDPYFPFENAVDVWARTFAALGIDYRGSTMRLDLCDRPGKYSNGFCHWPVPAYRKVDGAWVPAQTNFTSLATPGSVGSGKTALVTLLHEGGHAAHFANVDQASPLCSQERAPTSVAYAENQSMLLDSLAGDAAWLARYARDAAGQPVPWSLVREAIEAGHPYAAFSVRSMLAVPYFEKALYDLPDDQITPERILSLADEVEARVEGGPAPRPLLSVPHILSDESSAYYHGYVLAEMGVHQARAHFLKTLGRIVDEPEVGAALTRVYWQPGNSVPFLDLVERLTEAPLTADAWVKELQVPVEVKVAEEEVAYREALEAGPRIPPGSPVDLNMRILLVHGDETVADTEVEGSLPAACAKYTAWLANKGT